MGPHTTPKSRANPEGGESDSHGSRDQRLSQVLTKPSGSRIPNLPTNLTSTLAMFSNVISQALPKSALPTLNPTPQSLRATTLNSTWKASALRVGASFGYFGLWWPVLLGYLFKTE